jgi:hypothetical protein
MHHLDVPRLPGLVEIRLEWAVETQDRVFESIRVSVTMTVWLSTPTLRSPSRMA